MRPVAEATASRSIAPTATTFSNFSTDDTGGDGVNFQSSSKSALTVFESDDNGGDGVAFTKNCNKNSLSGYDTSSNGGDGVFVDPSSNDKVADGTVDDNTLNGIEIARAASSTPCLQLCLVRTMGASTCWTTMPAAPTARMFGPTTASTLRARQNAFSWPRLLRTGVDN